jgi:hypothetical protein
VIGNVPWGGEPQLAETAMSHSALYDDDILLWSEQQAEIIRRLGRARRDLPNEFDVENVAEEVESVGRSELAAVESHLQNILVHLIKLLATPPSDAADHWRGEMFGFHSEMRRRYAPSMRQRINVDQLWRLARTQALLLLSGSSALATSLPKDSPFLLDDLLAERLDTDALVEKLVSKSEPKSLADLADRLFGKEGGVDLDLPPRGQGREPPDFTE